MDLRPEPLTVGRETLARACAAALARLAPAVALPGPAYWTVLGDEAYDFRQVPVSLGVGDLGDDLRRVQALAERGDALPLSLALESLAAVLRALSDADL